jgi:hypothetical protein
MVPLNWTNDQPRDFYDALADRADPALRALDDALDVIEDGPESAAARPRSISAAVAGVPLWLVDVRHSSRDLQILWQEDDHGEPMLVWIGEARFPRR